jgi:hypothetical protein
LLLRMEYEEAKAFSSSPSPSPSPSASASSVMSKSSQLLTLQRLSSSNKYNTPDYDLWDILIDRVSVISSCRNQEILSLTKLLNTSLTQPFLPANAFDSYFRTTPGAVTSAGGRGTSGLTNAIPTPSKSLHAAAAAAGGAAGGAGGATSSHLIATKKGTPSLTTLTNNKHVSGIASVKLKHAPAPALAAGGGGGGVGPHGGATSVSSSMSSKVAHTISMARELLNSMSSEIQYVEIYRRLIPIPILFFDQFADSSSSTSSSSASSSASASCISSPPNFNRTLRDWFEYFDRNGDGNITFEELRYALNGLNAKLSNDCLKTLFFRFQMNNSDEFVDWNDFLMFYETFINRKFIETISIDQTGAGAGTGTGGGGGGTGTVGGGRRGAGAEHEVDMIKLLCEFLFLYSSSSFSVNETLAPTAPTAAAAPADAISPAETPAAPGAPSAETPAAPGAPSAETPGPGGSRKTTPSSLKHRGLSDELVTLNRNDLHRNTQLVNQSGLKISSCSMDRISRLFDYDISHLKQFHRSLQKAYRDRAAAIAAAEAATAATGATGATGAGAEGGGGGGGALESKEESKESMKSPPQSQSQSQSQMKPKPLSKVTWKEFILIRLIQEMSGTLQSLLTAISSRCQTNAAAAAEGGGEGGGEGRDKGGEISFESFNLTTEEEFSKLWLAMAPSCQISVRDDHFMSYIESILSQHYNSAASTSSSTSVSAVTSASTAVVSASMISAVTSIASASAVASKKPPPQSLFVSEEILKRRIFCHLIRDEISYSSWNKIPSSNSRSSSNSSSSSSSNNRSNSSSNRSSSSSSSNSGSESESRTISYSAFKAFVLRSHIEIIEQKLQYLVYLQNSASKGSMSFLVHFFLPTMQEGPFRDETLLNHLIMIAYDPLSSAIYSMKVLYPTHEEMDDTSPSLDSSLPSSLPSLLS